MCFLCGSDVLENVYQTEQNDLKETISQLRRELKNKEDRLDQLRNELSSLQNTKDDSYSETRMHLANQTET